MSELHAQTVAFARDTMLPPAPPPAREAGAVRWVRENLLSGPLNILLTVLSLWLIWVVLRDALPWAWRGIWRAENATGCRAIRDQLYGPGVPAACWAVLSDRWRQLVFGFYPAGQLWRPVLSLVLFLLAVTPILFSALPRRLLWGTAAAPFLIFWLIWGGSAWGPASVALGLALAAWLGVAFGRRGALAGMAALAVAVLLLFFDPLSWLLGLLDRLSLALTGAAPFRASTLREIFPLAEPARALLERVAEIRLPVVRSADIGGFTLSTIIGLSGITLSLPLGILLALGRRSDMPLIAKLCVAYIETIRGVPLIVWLFVAQLILNYFLPRDAAWKPDLVLRVIVMVTLFSAAYIAEVVRGGLAAVPKGQLEAADAMGLDYWQSMRLVVLPQALRISIPGIVNSFIGLFKDTTLVSIISMFDPIRIASTIRATTDWGGIYWELYVFIGLVFFAFCFSMSRYSLWLERRLERDRRH